MKNPIKNAGKMLDGMKDAGKQIKSTIIVAVACLVVIGIGNFASGIFVDAGRDATAEMNRLKTEIDTMQRNADLGAGLVQPGVADTEGGTRVEWVGNSVDTGRWMTDEEAFWNWIYPAFNYRSATEYNKAREDFKSAKGLGDCLFTTQFLTYYDTSANALKKYPAKVNDDGTPTDDAVKAVDEAYQCTSDKSLFRTWPIGETANGDYRYMAQVYMGMPGSDNEQTPVTFMFTMMHTTGQGGQDTMSISDFECWPPSTGR